MIELDANGGFITLNLTNHLKQQLVDAGEVPDKLQMSKMQWKKIVRTHEEVLTVKEHLLEWNSLPVELVRGMPDTVIFFLKENAVVGKLINLEP